MKKLIYVAAILLGMNLLVSYSCSGQVQTKDKAVAESSNNDNEGLNSPKIIKIENYNRGFDNAIRYRVIYENGVKIVYRLLENDQLMVCSNITPNEDYDPEIHPDSFMDYNDYRGELVIPESVIINNKKHMVTAIEEMAFWDTGITSIVIPKTITNIVVGSFMHDIEEWPGFGTESAPLEKIVVLDGNPRYDSRENCNAIIETVTNTLIVGCKNTVIPEGVRSIGDWAFCDCDIVSLTIPNSVDRIGYHALYNCYELFSVIINNPNLEIDIENVFGATYEYAKTHIKGGKIMNSKDVFNKDASSYYYTEADLRNLSAQELTYLRNQVYAKHGYIFKSQELNNYFKQFGWYYPRAGVSDAVFNRIEKANVEFIKNYQEQTGKTYKPQ